MTNDSCDVGGPILSIPSSTTIVSQYHVLVKMTPPLIALEEHYYSNAIFESIGNKFQRTLQAVPGLVDQLQEVGNGRLAAMDHGHISLQVVSHAFTPGKRDIPSRPPYPHLNVE